MIRYYGGLMMGLLMDESARRSYDADREDLRGRLPSPRPLKLPCTAPSVGICTPQLLIMKLTLL